MFVVNNYYDLSDYILQEPAFNFELNNVPGSLTYNPITTLEIKYDLHIDPNNSNSPFYEISKGNKVLYEVSYFGVLQDGIITDFVINNNKITLTLESNISQILQNNVSLLSELDKTPIEILIYLCELYGIEINSSQIGVIREYQKQTGLIYDFEILIDDKITLVDYMNSINQSGFMRTCIYNKQLYFISNLWQDTKLSLELFEVRNKPTMSEMIKPQFNGGELETPLGKQEFTPRSGEPTNKLSLNYSSGNIVMYNLSGAYELLRLYNQAFDYRTYEFVLPSYIVNTLEPGDCIFIKRGILGKDSRIARFVSANKSDHYYNCKLEVRNV